MKVCFKIIIKIIPQEIKTNKILDPKDMHKQDLEQSQLSEANGVWELGDP